ncbi:acyltransferase family protein [Arthrobacter sp. PvP023]
MSIARALASPRRTGADTGTNRKSKFRPEIQGLRSLAVLMVVSYHVWFGRVSGGVDVFLLISAFLMTLQFVGKYEQGRPMALFKHWLHLFRRLLPAAVTVIVATLAASYLFLPRTRWLEIVDQAWASLFYYENALLQARAVDYYATDHSLASPFQHFWSLSIQGQIFILWPLTFAAAALLAVRFRLHYRVLLCYVFGAIFVVSLIYSILFTADNQAQAYFDTGARLWEFALGTLVALLLPGLRIPRGGRIALGWFGIAAMLCCGILLNVQAAFPGVAALWPTLAAASVIAAGQTGSRYGVDRILSSGPLVRLGDNSYALYLWHWPVLVIALAATGRDHAGPISGTIIIVLSMGLAFITTKFIEKPWREWGWPEVNRRRAVLAVAACVITAVVPLTAIQVQQHFAAEAAQAAAERNNPGAKALLPGFVDRSDSDAALLPTAEQLPLDWATLSGPCTGELEPDVDIVKDTCSQNQEADEPAKSVLVLGDSHAQQWLAAIGEVGQQKGWTVYAMLKGGCQVQPSTPELEQTNPDCARYNEAVREQIAKTPPDAIMVVGTAAAPSSPAEVLTPGLEESARSWSDQGIDVVAIRDNPRFDFNMADCVVTKGKDSPDCRLAVTDVLASESPFSALNGKVDGLSFVDMTDLICDGTSCPGVVGNTFVYLDNNHLTRTYVASMSAAFGERLMAATAWTD